MKVQQRTLRELSGYGASDAASGFIKKRRIVLKRKILKFALLSLAAVACLSAPVFAQDKPSVPVTTRPAGWGMTGDNPGAYDVSVDTTTKRDGKASASLQAKPTAVEKKFGSLVQAVRPDKFRGKRVRFSGYVKTDKVNGHAAMWIRVDGPNMEMLDFSNMDERPIKGTTDWKRYDLVIDVPTNAEAILFGALLDGAKGQMWVDDISLDVVNRDVAKTSNPISEKDRREAEDYARQMPKDELAKIIASYRSLPVEPENLDFERVPTSPSLPSKKP